MSKELFKPTGGLNPIQRLFHRQGCVDHQASGKFSEFYLRSLHSNGSYTSQSILVRATPTGCRVFLTKRHLLSQRGGMRQMPLRIPQPAPGSYGVSTSPENLELNIAQGTWKLLIYYVTLLLSALISWRFQGQV